MKVQNRVNDGYCEVCGTTLTFEQSKIYDPEDHYIHCSNCGCIKFSLKKYDKIIEEMMEKYGCTDDKAREGLEIIKKSSNDELLEMGYDIEDIQYYKNLL